MNANRDIHRNAEPKSNFLYRKNIDFPFGKTPLTISYRQFGPLSVVENDKHLCQTDAERYDT